MLGTLLFKICFLKQINTSNALNWSKGTVKIKKIDSISNS